MRRGSRHPRRYHPLVRANLPPTLPIDTTLLKPGLRLAVALSGGADSVALLCALATCATELGLVLHVAHLHHGLRAAEADADLEFARSLAERLNLPFHFAQVDTAAEARAHSESIEEAARRLRYSWLRQLLAEIPLDAACTAHTCDDQAETVLAKFLRGAWTEGLSGIAPKLEFPEGLILRPLLATTRAEIEAYLDSNNQPWREDSSNRHLGFTRNRIRHELLPLLETWNPQLRSHLAEMSALARDEDAFWRAELDRVAPQLLLAGKPVRGGGRASAIDPAQSLALDVTRLAALPVALQRRLLRHAAARLGAAPDFHATESLRSLALSARAGQRLELAAGLRAERTPRELRLYIQSSSATSARQPAEFLIPIPGEVDAPIFGLHLRIESAPSAQPVAAVAPAASASASQASRTATLRNWRPGDRVRLRHSAAPRKVKEILERMRVTGTRRALWPVLELDGSIAWMRDVEVEPVYGLNIIASELTQSEPTAPGNETYG